MKKNKVIFMVLLFALLGSGSMFAQFDPGTDPVPTAFVVTGDGSYLQGGVGLPVGLTSSELGVTYTLYKGAVAQTPTVSGTGLAITFGNQLAGTYTVKGVNTFGTTDMNGSAVIVETTNPVPTKFNVTGTGTYPIGGTGLVVGLDGSQTGVTYTLYKNDVAQTPTVAGTGSPISFGIQLKGTYTVVGTSPQYTPPTTSTMNGSAVIAEEAAPQFKQLSLKVFLQGFYNTTNSNMNQCQDYNATATPQFYNKFSGTVVDLITVELHNATTYATVEYTVTDVELQKNGSCNSSGNTTIEIPTTFTGSYYITIKTRNHIETTSAAPVSFANGTISYDFTTAKTMAYGDNQVAVGSIFAIYVGDIGQDGTIMAATDYAMEKTSVVKGEKGYLVTDLDGDGAIMAATDYAKLKTAVVLGVKRLIP